MTTMPKYNIVELLSHVMASRFSAKQSPIYQAKLTRLGIASSQRTLLAMTYTTALMQSGIVTGIGTIVTDVVIMKVMNGNLEPRTQRVLDGLMGDESLMADLQTEAAQALLDWGMACARAIVRDTAEIDGEEAAEEAMYPRLRALRKMMRQINFLLSRRAGLGVVKRAQAIREILAQAEVVYGAAFVPPGLGQRISLLCSLSQEPQDWIRSLRTCLEPARRFSATSPDEER